jgi:SAM-dependent methyltransferase
LITATSPRFLRMISAKLRAAGIDRARVRLATLAGEDLGKLRAASIDTIVIASALHHVGDWRAFMRDAAQLLRPGGNLVIQEPCREGNLMMGMALDVALSPLWPKDAALSDDDVMRLQNCRDSIYFLADSHTVKVGEDKHSFLASELAAAADEAGFFRSVFYSNFHFQDLADSDLSKRQGCASFIGYLDSFLEQHHRVSSDGLAKLRTHLFPALKRIDATFIAGDGAPLLGCMVFCR